MNIRSHPYLHLAKNRTFWIGIVVGALLVSGWQALTYHDWHSVVSPVGQGPLVVRRDVKGEGSFGAPRSGGRRHRGIDLAASLGDPVRAIRSGIVSELGKDSGLGTYIELVHPDGMTSIYAHLASSAVSLSQRVRQGQIIGTVGKSGNARHPAIMPHLHLETWKDGKPFDPAELGLVIAASSNSAQSSEAKGGN